MEVWKAVFFSTLFSIICTFIPAADIEIYIPLLIGYFIFILVLIIRVRYKHIIKYKYNPFDYAKVKYNNK